MSRRRPVKCHTCGGSSNVGYAPYPGMLPGARGDAVLSVLTLTVYGVPQPAGEPT